MSEKQDFFIFFINNQTEQIYEFEYDAKFWNVQVSPCILLICWGQFFILTISMFTLIGLFIYFKIKGRILSKEIFIVVPEEGTITFCDIIYKVNYVRWAFY